MFKGVFYKHCRFLNRCGDRVDGNLVNSLHRMPESTRNYFSDVHIYIIKDYFFYVALLSSLGNERTCNKAIVDSTNLFRDYFSM